MDFIVLFSMIREMAVMPIETNAISHKRELFNV